MVVKAEVTLKVTTDDGVEHTLVFEGDGAEYTMQRGKHRETVLGSVRCELSPNGKYRAQIRVWSGIPEYHDEIDTEGFQ